MTKHRVASIDSLANDSLTPVSINGRLLCIARTADGEVFAIDDICSHEEFSLSEGQLVGCEVECSAHFARFDLRNGAATAEPADTPIGSYPVSIQGDDVFVELD